jgi:hypothetical protein
VQNSKITDAGVKALQEAVPSVKVEGETNVDVGTQGTRGHRWALATTAIAVVATLCLAALARLIRKRRNSPEKLHPATAPGVAPPSINLHCGHCNQKIRVSADLAGKAAKCPGCGTPIEVPSLKRAPPAKAAQGNA